MLEATDVHDRTWQLIDTAPLGKLVLTWSDPEGTHVSSWIEDCWMTDGDTIIRPTHWMPLPEPPKQQ